MKKLLTLFSTMIILTLFLLFGRQWYDSLLARIDYQQMVHSDHSTVTSGIHSQVPQQVILVYQNSAGKTVRVLAQAHQYSQFINQQLAYLEQAKHDLSQQTEQHLHEALTPIFNELNNRINRFADWYFAYPTTYQIWWEAILSVTRHSLTPEAISLEAAVAYDVERYLQKHYENIVLRPEITHPQLHIAYVKVLQTTHRQYLTTLSQLQTAFQALVANHTTHLNTLPEDSQLVLDWETQFKKINISSDYEKGAKGAALGSALATGGAVLGKALTKGVTTKTLTTAAKPLVSKAVVMGAEGVTVGALGGPVGIVLGALGGLGIDYAINEGVELTQRDHFVKDLQEALLTTRMEWEAKMLQSLQEAITIWIDDTIQLLPRYQPPKQEEQL